MKYIDLSEYPMFGIVVFPDGSVYINRFALPEYRQNRIVLGGYTAVPCPASRILLLPQDRQSRKESSASHPSRRLARTAADQ